MSRDESNWVNDFFTASSRDLTPASARHAAQLLYTPVSYDSEVTRRCASLLTDIELQRADRFVSPDDTVLFIQRRAFRRYCGALALGSPQSLSRSLSKISFVETENGRPYLRDLPDSWFSFSSCRFGFVGAWSSTHGIGVDFEDQTRDLQATAIAQQFFSIAEARTVERAGGLASQQAFFQFWSLKEASLKSIGEGLPFGLGTFEFELDPGPRVVDAPFEYGGPEQFDAHLIEVSGGYTALVIRSVT